MENNYQHGEDEYGIVDESFEEVEQQNDDLNDLLTNNCKKRKSFQPKTSQIQNFKLNETRVPAFATKSSKSTNENEQVERLLAFRIDRICEYAECLMHCILFKINFYNKKTNFEKVIKYNIVVYVSCNCQHSIFIWCACLKL